MMWYRIKLFTENVLIDNLPEYEADVDAAVPTNNVKHHNMMHTQTLPVRM